MVLYKKFFSDQILDFVMCCKQTEISYHSDEPKILINRILKQNERKKKSKSSEEANKQIKDTNAV